MNLTKEAIKALFAANIKNVVDSATLSNSAKFNLGLTSRYPKGTVLTFAKDAIVALHQFKDSKGNPLFVATLCLTDGTNFISINSLNRKGYDTASPKEGTFPTIKVCTGTNNVLFTEVKDEAGKSLFMLKNELTLTSNGSETFNYADFVKETNKVKVIDGVICTLAQSSTMWDIK